jgi:hypothetical protein
MLGKRFRIGVIDILAVMGGSLLAAPFVVDDCRAVPRCDLRGSG